MKKITLLALALVAIAACTDCSQGEYGSSSSHQSSSSQVASSSRSSRISEMPEETPEIVDKSFTFKNDKGQDIPAYAVYTKESITFYTEDKAPDIIAKLDYPEKTEGKLKTLTVTADKDGKKNEIITITADFEFEDGEKAKYVWVSGDGGYTYNEEFSYKKGETPAKGE